MSKIFIHERFSWINARYTYVFKLRDLEQNITFNVNTHFVVISLKKWGKKNRTKRHHINLGTYKLICMSYKFLKDFSWISLYLFFIHETHKCNEIFQAFICIETPDVITTR